MNFTQSFGAYYDTYRQFQREMKRAESTPPCVYGEYLQKKRRKKKHRK